MPKAVDLEASHLTNPPVTPHSPCCCIQKLALKFCELEKNKLLFKHVLPVLTEDGTIKYAYKRSGAYGFKLVTV